MERLTERDENGVAFAKSPDAAVKMFGKLANYEDLEEKLVAHTGMNFRDWLKHTTSMFDER